MSELEVFDCIVVGLGGHGSSTIAQLARSYPNKRFLGVEQYGCAHELGSSHGRSRVFRQAYFEDPKYVPLLRRAFKLFNELSDEFYMADLDSQKADPSARIFTVSGGLMIGDKDSVVVKGTLNSIAEFNLPHRVLSSADIKREYSIFEPLEHEIGVFEAEAGYIHPEACIEAYIRLARQHGAELKFNETFLSYASNPLPDGSAIITVKTNNGEYRTRKLVLTVGAWAPVIYGSVLPPHLQLHVERRVLYWFEPTVPADYKNLPVYIWDLGVCNFYGFPELPEPSTTQNLKVAFHNCYNAALQCESAATVDRIVSAQDEQEMRSALATRMPTLNGRLVDATVCMYTMTPDEHFLIDFHPSDTNVILASPCSGHGFKFTSVIGEVLSEMVMLGASVTHDVSFLGLHARLPNHGTSGYTHDC